MMARYQSPIATQPIAESGFDVLCPHCQMQLYRLLPADLDCPHGPVFSDGDTIPLTDLLTYKQQHGFGWEASLDSGACPNCQKMFFQISASFMDVDPSLEVEDTFFHQNGDCGVETNFIASTSDEQWTVTRLDTPQGPLLHHRFGPYRDLYGDWIGPNGVTTCSAGGPWEMARTLLLRKWEDLRRMPKAVGLAASDPRAKSHKTGAPAKHVRAAWAAGRPAAPGLAYVDYEAYCELNKPFFERLKREQKTEADPDRLDDDIPF